MIGAILGLIPGLFTTVNGITKAISDERIQKIKAKTEEERIQADERIKTLEAQRQVLLSKTSHWETRLMMFLYGIGPAVVLTKIYVYDKAFGQWTHGVTDKLDDNLWWVITAQIGFYFLAATALRIAGK